MRQEAQRATADVSMPRAGIVTELRSGALCGAGAVAAGRHPYRLSADCIAMGRQRLGHVCAAHHRAMWSTFIFQQGGKEAGVHRRRQFYSAKTKPLAVPSGEFWLVHQIGTDAQDLRMMATS